MHPPDGKREQRECTARWRSGAPTTRLDDAASSVLWLLPLAPRSPWPAGPASPKNTTQSEQQMQRIAPLLVLVHEHNLAASRTYRTKKSQESFQTRPNVQKQRVIHVLDNISDPMLQTTVFALRLTNSTSKIKRYIGI